MLGKNKRERSIEKYENLEVTPKKKRRQNFKDALKVGSNFS